MTCDDWDGDTGGVLIFRARGLVQVLALAKIDASYKGFIGGASAVGGWTNGYQGEGFFGTGSQGVYFNNSNGGGTGMMEVTYSSAGGGGGGYGTSGTDGKTTYNTWGYPIEGGYGGETAGNQFLAKLFMGGAGGSGDTYGGVSGKGGDGGGIIYISCDLLNIIGNIIADGENGQNGQNNGGGGGGAGGTIYIITTKNLDLGNNFLNAYGGGHGVGSAQGGTGGKGKIRLDAPLTTGITYPPVGYNGISYALFGTSITPDIIKPADQYWSVLNFGTNTSSPGTSIHIDILSSTDSVLKADVSSGTLLNNAGIGKNINSIKLKAILLNSYGNQTPILYDWSVEWTPTSVELAFFTIQFVQTTMNVILDWQTVTETNNYGFEVERATLDTWEKIGFVKGNGTTTIPQKYTLTDSLNTLVEQLPDNSIDLKYRLKQIDFNGKFENSPEVEVTIIQGPLTFSLSQNYPNPFNPVTRIKFEIPKLSHVKLTIFNILGREITTLVNEELKPGRYEFSWNASKNISGVYFYKIEAGSYSETRKMMLLR